MTSRTWHLELLVLIFAWSFNALWWSESKQRNRRISDSCQIQTYAYGLQIIILLTTAQVLCDTVNASHFDISRTICLSPVVIGICNFLLIAVDHDINRRTAELVGSFIVYGAMMIPHRHIRMDLLPIACIMSLVTICSWRIAFFLFDIISQQDLKLQRESNGSRENVAQEAQTDLSGMDQAMKDAMRVAMRNFALHIARGSSSPSSQSKGRSRNSSNVQQRI